MTTREPETVAGLSVAHLATGWSVVHAGSGLHAVTGLRLRRFAEDARRELLATGVDFTQDKAAFAYDQPCRVKINPVAGVWSARARASHLDPVTFEYYSEHVSFGQIVPSAKLAAHMAACAAELARAGRIEADAVPGKGARFVRELTELGLLVEDDRHVWLWAGDKAA